MSETLEQIALRVADSTPNFSYSSSSLQDFARRLVAELGAQEPIGNIYKDGWQAAFTAVMAGGVVAFADCLGTVRTQHELDKLKRFCDERYRTYDRPLYKLPEGMK